MGDDLKPTLWRTARALCNADRLKLMRLVANGRGAKGVVELASEAGLPVAENIQRAFATIGDGRCRNPG